MSLALISLLALIGFLTGFSKTAIGGIGLVNAALLATILPAKESMGVMLILLITGDLFAIGIYKKHVEWKMLRSLIWPIIFGIFAGVYFLSRSTDASLKHTIGAIVILLVILYPISQRLQNNNFSLNLRYPKSLRLTLGVMTGFMSMVANSGGPPMSIYLLLRKNLFKLPFVFALGLLDFNSLSYIIPALPLVPLGALLGRKVINKINQELFQNITLISAALAGLNLLIG
jgi:uncharacterized membrane protein YfcA